MAKELAMITVAAIAAVSALAGMAVQWAFNSITADTAARRTEKADRRKAIEDRYLSVQTSIELFLRSKIRGADLNQQLAHLNAVVDLFGDDGVRSSFVEFQKALDAFHKAHMESGKKYVLMTDAAEDFIQEWNDLITAQKAISTAMREHMATLRSFGD